MLVLANLTGHANPDPTELGIITGQIMDQAISGTHSLRLNFCFNSIGRISYWRSNFC